jgi:hypothetical protein
MMLSMFTEIVFGLTLVSAGSTHCFESKPPLKGVILGEAVFNSIGSRQQESSSGSM